MMFLLNLGYKWTLASQLSDLGGVVVLPAHNNCARLQRAGRFDVSKVLLDPQLYLAGLGVADCLKTCARLSTYPWFGVKGVPQFDSSSQKRAEWEKEVSQNTASAWTGAPPDDPELACHQALELQENLGCSYLIIPAPLMSEREDEGGTVGDWLDAGLKAEDALETGRPLLATVALNETVLNEAVFAEAGFLDAIVDHVTARDGLAGVYVVVAQSGVAKHPFQTGSSVLRAYSRLVRRFYQAGLPNVIVNFCDVFGIATCALGATAFATGPSQSLRRLSLNGFRDEGGGKALPHLYSHRAVSEYLSETDLAKVVKANLFRRISDSTQYSKQLIEEIQRGGTAGNLGAWAESQNNIGNAQLHFIERMRVAGLSLATATDGGMEQLLDWLDDAEATSLVVAKRVKSNGDSKIEKVAPTNTWAQILREEGDTS